MRTVDSAIYRIELRNKQNLDTCDYLFDAKSGKNAVKVFNMVLQSFPQELTTEHINLCFEQIQAENGSLRNLKIHLQDKPMTIEQDPRGIYGYGQIRVVRLAETSSYTDREGNAVFRSIPDEHLREQKHAFFIGISKEAPVGFIFSERRGLYYLADYIDRAYRQVLSEAYNDKVIKIEPHISDVEINAAKEYGFLRKITLIKKNISSDITDIEVVKEKSVQINREITINFPKQRIRVSKNTSRKSSKKEVQYSDIEHLIVNNPEVANVFTFGNLGDFEEASFTVEHGEKSRTFRLGAQRRFLPVYEIANVEEASNAESRGDLNSKSWYSKAKDHFFQTLHEQGFGRYAE